MISMLIIVSPRPPPPCPCLGRVRRVQLVDALQPSG